MNNCYMDFDGTIVDNKKRLFKFFTDNMNQKYKNVLTIDEFWNLKRLGVNEVDWMNSIYNANLNKIEWNKCKKDNIESEYYLRYNELFDFSKEALTKIKNYYNIILVTKRSICENFYEELKSYKIEQLFDDILVLGENYRSKADYIKEKYHVSRGDIVVGDTEDDIECAIELDLKCILLNSGIRSRWIIQKYSDCVSIIDFMENIAELATKINIV